MSHKFNIEKGEKLSRAGTDLGEVSVGTWDSRSGHK